MRLPSDDQVIITHSDRTHPLIDSRRELPVGTLPSATYQLETRIASLEIDTGVPCRAVRVDRHSATVALTSQDPVSVRFASTSGIRRFRRCPHGAFRSCSDSSGAWVCWISS